MHAQSGSLLSRLVGIPAPVGYRRLVSLMLAVGVFLLATGVNPGFAAGPSGAKGVETDGQEAALLPEEADGLTDVEQEPGQEGDADPLVTPRLVPDPALVASEKADAGGLLPREETARESSDEPVTDPNEEATADQAAEDPEDRDLDSEAAPTEEATGATLTPGLNEEEAPAVSVAQAASVRNRVLRNRPGLSASRINRSIPPDSTGAIGPDNYVELVNSRIAVYRRDLSRVAETSLSAFVGARRRDSVFDPQIQWDPQAQRWFYLMDRVVNRGQRNEVNYLAFGWSRTANPQDLRRGWCRFFFRTGNLFEDYPKLGHSDNHLIFGTNVFRGGDFTTARISALPKPPNDSRRCSRPSRRVFGSPGRPLLTADRDRVFTPVPANTFGNSQLGYVVAADFPTPDMRRRDQVMVWHIAGERRRPELVPDGNIEVGGYQIPPNAPQPRTRLTLDTLDTRLTQAVAAPDPDAGGQLAVWTQHTIRAPDRRAQVRWYEFLPATLARRQEGNVQTPGRFVFNGAISPASSGNAAVVNYNVGGRRLLVRLRARSRGPSTPPGGMEGEVTLGRSAAAARDISCFDRQRQFGVCRWGDYAGASPDPRNGEAVWGSNQLQGPRSRQMCTRPDEPGRPRPCPSWRTRNFAIGVTPRDQIIDSDGIATATPGAPRDQQVTPGKALAAWPTGGGQQGLDMFDNDANGAWTFGAAGDDLHLEDPAGACGTAVRNTVYDLGRDCKVLDINSSLANGQPVNCDLETGGRCPSGVLANLRFHDANGSGRYENAEDIVFDVNRNGVFDP